MVIFAVKCGQTDQDKYTLGQTNPGINSDGREYAGLISERLGTVGLDAVYTSPLFRAFNVAKEIHTWQKDETCTFVVDSSLTDMDYGDLTGKPLTDADVICHNMEPFTRFPNGESYMDIAVRVYPFLSGIREKYRNHERIAVVTHEPVIKIMKTYCEDITVDQFRYNRPGIAKITRLTV